MSRAKLTPEDAAEIRRRAGDGEAPQQIARRFGVSAPHARAVIAGGYWQEPRGGQSSRRGPVPWEEITFWVERAGLAATGEAAR